MTYNQNDAEGTSIAFVNCGLFYAALLIYEIIFRILSKKPLDVSALNDLPSMSVEEFENRICRGEQLVLLGNLILDISKFKLCHPAGAFSLERCVGRDISKYFDGGYSLENDLAI